VALDEHLQRIEWQPTSVLLTESAA
jgi:hypothetical protein